MPQELKKTEIEQFEIYYQCAKSLSAMSKKGDGVSCGLTLEKSTIIKTLIQKMPEGKYANFAFVLGFMAKMVKEDSEHLKKYLWLLLLTTRYQEFRSEKNDSGMHQRPKESFLIYQVSQFTNWMDQDQSRWVTYDKRDNFHGYLDITDTELRSKIKMLTWHFGDQNDELINQYSTDSYFSQDQTKLKKACDVLKKTCTHPNIGSFIILLEHYIAFLKLKTTPGFQHSFIAWMADKTLPSSYSTMDAPFQNNLIPEITDVDPVFAKGFEFYYYRHHVNHLMQLEDTKKLLYYWFEHVTSISKEDFPFFERLLTEAIEKSPETPNLLKLIFKRYKQFLGQLELTEGRVEFYEWMEIPNMLTDCDVDSTPMHSVITDDMVSIPIHAIPDCGKNFTYIKTRETTHKNKNGDANDITQLLPFSSWINQFISNEDMSYRPKADLHVSSFFSKKTREQIMNDNNPKALIEPVADQNMP